MHKTHTIDSTLVVEKFGVKYEGKKHALQLESA